MIRIGQRAFNPDHVALVTHPAHSAHLEIYLSTGKVILIDPNALASFIYDDKTTPLEALVRAIEDHQESALERLARSVRGLH